MLRRLLCWLGFHSYTLVGKTGKTGGGIKLLDFLCPHCGYETSWGEDDKGICS